MRPKISLSSNFFEKEVGEVHINLMEDDLVISIEKILSQNVKTDEDARLISYYEMALKKIILKGMTIIFTCFKMIGERMA